MFYMSLCPHNGRTLLVIVFNVMVLSIIFSRIGQGFPYD